MTDKTPQQSELAGTDTVDRANHNAKLDQLEAFRSDATGEALRTNQGVKIADNQNTLKAGGRGPSLLEDFIMREKITHFDHERIPERIVHARGSTSVGSGALALGTAGEQGSARDSAAIPRRPRDPRSRPCRETQRAAPAT